MLDFLSFSRIPEAEDAVLAESSEPASSGLEVGG
jgi:hypothetical protein